MIPTRRSPRLACRMSVAVLCVAVALAAPAVASDECPNGGNLVSNCGIEAPGGISGDLTGWELIAGDDFDPSSQFFHSGGFSADIDAALVGETYRATMRTCIRAVVPGEIYLFGAWRRLTGATASLTCTVALEERGASPLEGDPACLGSALAEYVTDLGPAEGSWELLLSKFVAHENVVDIAFALFCADETAESADFQVNFDDAFLIPLGVVFLDDFEFFPDSCAWSASVGGGCE